MLFGILCEINPYCHTVHHANIRMCTTGTDLLFKSNEIINTHKNIANRMFTLLMVANMILHLHI